MSLALIRTEIKAKLDSISNVGKVNDYRRHHVDWEKIAESFIDGGRINGWFFEWISAPQTKVASGSIVLTRSHGFRIWGLYSLKDNVESAKTFEGIVEEVLNEFSNDQDLISKVRWPDNAPPTLISMDERVFVGVLCHRCQIGLTYNEQLAFA